MQWLKGLLGATTALGLVACAGNGAKETQTAAEMPPPEPVAAGPAVEEEAPMEGPAREELGQVAGKEGKQLQVGETYMKETGEFKRKTGEFTEESGTWYQPKGTYGARGTFQTKGEEGIKGTYGTFVRPEAQYRAPERVEVSQEGMYVEPFDGKGPKAIESLEELERQPVAGREAAQPGKMFLVSDEQGRAFVITDPQLIKTVERKLQANQCDPGAIDGTADAQLNKALVQFQARQGIKQTGAFNKETAQALGVDWQPFEDRLRALQGRPGQEPKSQQPQMQPEQHQMPQHQMPPEQQPQ